MKLVGDPEAEAWLEALSAEAFEWDSGNRSKTARSSSRGRIVDPVHDEPRWLLLGETNAGRRLALIFTRRGSKLRPISCRPMRRNERKVYDEAKVEGSSQEGR